MNKSIYVGMSADLIHPGHLSIIAEASKLEKLHISRLRRLI